MTWPHHSPAAAIKRRDMGIAEWIAVCRFLLVLGHSFWVLWSAMRQSYISIWNGLPQLDIHLFGKVTRVDTIVICAKHAPNKWILIKVIEMWTQPTWSQQPANRERREHFEGQTCAKPNNPGNLLCKTIIISFASEDAVDADSERSQTFTTPIQVLFSFFVFFYSIYLVLLSLLCCQFNTAPMR